MSTLPRALDRKALAVIIVLGLVVAPGMILLAGWRISRGFDVASMTVFEWVAASLGTLLLAVIVRLIAVELRESIGVRIDGEGVKQAAVSLRWDAITEVRSPHHGKLELRDASGRMIRIATYLFADRAGLLAYIGDRVGVEIRERTLSF